MHLVLRVKFSVSCSLVLVSLYGLGALPLFH